MEKNRGFIGHRDERGHWRQIADNWSTIIDNYVKLEEDMPTWFGEQSNVALLSAASWRAGIPSLVEFGMDRNRKLDLESGLKEYSRGRCDFYLSQGKNGEFVEAKWRNLDINSLAKADGCFPDADDRLSSALTRAREDAATLKHSARGMRTGIVCVSLYAPVSSIDLSDRCLAVIETLRSRTYDTSFAFWHFLREKDMPKDGAGYRAVGAFVIGRATKRRHENNDDGET